MLRVGERIRECREALDMTQDELARRTGYKSRSSINKIEKGGNDLPQSKIVIFAKALRTTPSYLMGWEEENPDPVGHFSNIFPVRLKRFPMLGSIACGEPIFADEDREHFVMADMDVQADFCLRAKGDSMINARINDGDIVFIRSAPIVDNGEIAAVVIDDEATLKRVYYDRASSTLTLAAENPRFAPLVYRGEELDHIRILGRAVYFMSAL